MRPPLLLLSLGLVGGFAPPRSLRLRKWSAPPKMADERGDTVFVPDNYQREAGRVVSSLKTNAALLCAYSFSNLDGRFMESAPHGDGAKLVAYVLLVAATLGFELSAVFIGMQLLYRLYDGSFGSETLAGPAGGEDRRTVMGLIVANYQLEFYTLRGCFIAGIFCVLAATDIKARRDTPRARAARARLSLFSRGKLKAPSSSSPQVWAEFDLPLAAAVTAIIVACGSTMAFFALRSQALVFDRLEAVNREATLADADGVGAS